MKRWRASITVEASLVFPIYFFAVMAIVSLLFVLRYVNSVECAMNETLEQLSAYSYLYDQVEQKKVGQIVTPVLLRLEFERHLKGKDLEQWLSINHGLGVSFLGSQVFEEDKEIELLASYSVRVPLPVVSVIPIMVRQRMCGRAFVGANYIDEEKESDYVYVTAKGSVYHESMSCPYLSIRPREVSYGEVEILRNRSGAKYYLCRSCQEVERGDVVYVTDYGTRYHCAKECTQISREIKRISRSQVDSRRGCSRCALQERSEDGDE